MKPYGPSEFIQKLSANDLPVFATPTIAGLVKHDPAKPNIIEFSSSMSCERWLAIPTEMIEDITHLQYVRCKDHQHPLVKIKLKQPDKARVDLAFLLGLVSELQGTFERLALSPKTSAEARDEYGCYVKKVDPPGLVFVCCGEGECTGVAAI